MKGISAVIAVVLLLMITIALVGMAWVFFQNLWGTISTTAGEAAEGTSEAIASQFSIASASHTKSDNYATVYLTNTGSADIKLDRVNVFVNNKLTGKASGTFTGILSPGSTVSLKVNNKTINASADYNDAWCTNTTKVTYGSLEQVSTITC